MLEINSAPGMTVNSLVPKEALAAGISYEALMARLIDLGLQRSAKYRGRSIAPPAPSVENRDCGPSGEWPSGS
jgi:hypothetical protein